MTSATSMPSGGNSTRSKIAILAPSRVCRNSQKLILSPNLRSHHRAPRMEGKKSKKKLIDAKRCPITLAYGLSQIPHPVERDRLVAGLHRNSGNPALVSSTATSGEWQHSTGHSDKMPVCHQNLPEAERDSNYALFYPHRLARNLIWLRREWRKLSLSESVCLYLTGFPAVLGNFPIRVSHLHKNILFYLEKSGNMVFLRHSSRSLERNGTPASVLLSGDRKPITHSIFEGKILID
jgi:hypothetical protein